MRSIIVPKIAMAMVAVCLLRQQTHAQVTYHHEPTTPAVMAPSPHIAHGETTILVEEPYIQGPLESAPCSCSDCNSSAPSCRTCQAPFGLCFCLPSHGWVQAESLFWYPSGMRIPALLTTSTVGTARAQAGILGLPSTTILYGDEEILDGDSSGLRIRFGTTLAILCGIGIEGEYVVLDENESFYRESNGSTILARPFLNALDGGEDAELVAFPDVVTGNIAIETDSSFQGAAFRFRQKLCCAESCKPGWLDCTTLVPTASQVDLTVGYRFWELDETLVTRERLQQVATTPNQLFDITDTFDTRNLFNGLEFGINYRTRRRWWSLDALVRCSIGNVNQTVDISGATEVQVGAGINDSATGFLAQRSNIGRTSRDVFSIVPEVGLTLERQFNERLRFNLGYSAVYLGNVVRPGDQINTLINPNLLVPEADPFSGPLQPDFRFDEADFLVHGWSVGGVYQW